MNQSLLLWPILVPAIGGLICYVLAKQGRIAAIVGSVAALATFATCVLCCLFPPGTSYAYTWVSAFGLDVSISARLGMLSQLGIFFIGLFGFLIGCYSLPYMWGHRYEGRYWAFTLLALGGALGATLSDHLIFFLICWEVVTLMLYLLINLGREPANKVGAKTFVMLGLADAALLLGILFLWRLTDTLSIQRLADIGAGKVALMGGEVMKQQLPLTTGLGAVAFLLIFAAAVAKAGVIPLHTWLPSSSEGAPLPVMAFLPASLDKLLGICLLARAALQFFTVTWEFQLVLMIVGAVTVLGAIMMAMVQSDLRRLIAYMAVSSIGYAVLGIGTGAVVGVLGGLFQMLNCALYTCGLFLMVGAVRQRTGTSELGRLGGLARLMPVTFVTGLVAALAAAGVPPLNGFASKWMVYQGVVATQSTLAPLLLIAAVFGSALTLACFIKVIHSLFFGRASDEVAKAQVRESPPFMWMPMAVLAVLCIAFGVFAWAPVKLMVAPALAELNPEMLKPAWLNPASPEMAAKFAGLMGTWVTTSSQATVLLIVGLLLGLVFYLIGRAGKVRVARQFVGGELAGTDDYRVPGTGFYETVRGMPFVGGMIRDAEDECYDVYHLGGQYGTTLVQSLRRLHTGVLAVYVGWCVLGLAIVLLYLLPL